MTSPATPLTKTTAESVPFDNSYARLPDHFYARIDPTPVASPRLIKLNVELARHLNLDPEFLATETGVAILAGNRVVNGSEPLAQAYAGHQFGHFVPQLGDGRANLLGEVIAVDGKRYDIQLKGSGRTPFSRGGDGRAALGPVLREYIVSEAMHALGVPTTRALAAVATGEFVYRETPQPGAVFTRVAASHLRVGTFQYFAARGDTDAIKALADYAIARHYPELAQASNPYQSFLSAIIGRHARLVARWMQLGFIHGVMNTDNTSISGETIDFGPCAFMESYRPDTVFSSIDHGGRYAYQNQPHAAVWNLARLAEALLPLLAIEAGSEEAAVTRATESLESFDAQFQQARISGFLKKIGIGNAREGDEALVEDLLVRMSANKADFTLTFRRLAYAAASAEADKEVRVLFSDPTSYDDWAVKWRTRLSEESESGQARAAAMRAVNPLFIPRNHLVEAVIQAAVQRQDFQPFHDLLDVVTRPYEDRPGLEKFTAPARPEEQVLETFCGT